MIVTAVIVSLLLFGCNFLPLPSKQEVVNTFTANRDNIEIVTNYLRTYGISGTRIQRTGGRYTILGEEKEILDPEVVDAINQLLQSNAYVEIGVDGATIYFEQHRFLVEESCGVMYSANNLTPEVTYTIVKEAISCDGWYYYVADYNQWRIIQEEKSKLKKNFYQESDFESIVIGQSTYKEVCRLVIPTVMKYTDYGAYCTFQLENGGTILMKFQGEGLVVSSINKID